MSTDPGPEAEPLEPVTPAAGAGMPGGVRWRLIGGITALAAALLLGLRIALLGRPLGIDLATLTEFAGVRVDPWLAGAHALNVIGGGFVAVWLIPVLGAVVLLALRRPLSALFWLLSLAISAGLVQALKRLFGRVRPDDMELALESLSYPSGHSANAATFALVIALLVSAALPRLRLPVGLLAVAWTMAMMLSRALLGVHWLTDTIGGALLGIAVPLILWALLPEVRREAYTRRIARSAPPGS